MRALNHPLTQLAALALLFAVALVLAEVMTP